MLDWPANDRPMLKKGKEFIMKNRFINWKNGCIAYDRLKFSHEKPSFDNGDFGNDVLSVVKFLGGKL